MPDIDATTGKVIEDPPMPQATRMVTTPPGQIASIINIPPQIGTTLFWVAVGFGICWWMMKDRKS